MSNEYDIVSAFQKIEQELIQSMKRNLSRHIKEEQKENFNWTMWQAEQLKSLKEFRNNNPKLFKKYFSTINEDIEDVLKKAYESGKSQTEIEILENLKIGKSKNIKSSFFKVNDRKLKALIKEAQKGLNEARVSILRFTNDKYRKIIFNAQVYANTGAGTIQQTVDMATKDFLNTGINSIEYSNGNRVNIVSYVEMAIRTATKRAYLQGEGIKRDEWGIHTVIVHNRGGGCPFCSRYQGKVFIDDVWSSGTKEESKKMGYPLLSTAIAGGLFHPNCKDVATTYFPGMNSELNPPTKKEFEIKKQNYIKDQKLKLIDRNIEKYKRLRVGSLDKENIEKYRRKQLEWQEYKKRFKKNSNISFKDIQSSNDLSIPDLLERTIKEQNQVLNEKAKEFIDKNIKSNDIKEDKALKVPFAYNKLIDKIVINSNHEDIGYYNIDESIIHEVVHMKDIRNKITENNFEKLDTMMLKAKLYIDNNYNYFYKYLQKNSNNMSLCDIMSALSGGKMYGDFGHFPKYWKNDNIVLNELSANLISSSIVGNEAVENLLDEIPPLKNLKEECLKLWQV